MGKNYDYALTLIENEVRNDCEYYVYSRLRDVVDGLENDNEALTRLLKDALEKKYSKEDELQVENAKLRELVCRYVEYTSQDRCEGCVFKSKCNNGDVDECWQLTEIRELARELGIEVKE